MTDTALFRATVKALANGDAAEAKRLDAEIEHSDREAYNIYLAAVFFGAVGHRFQHDHSQEAIRHFVNEMAHEYRNATPALKPLTVEGLIRAAFGEDHFLDEISPDDQLMYQIPIIHKIVAQSEHMQQRLDDYLTDAETLASQWTSDDG